MRPMVCRRARANVDRTMVDVVSPALARRIALAAQGFGRPLPEAAGTRALNGVVDRLGLLQIDSVNVFERSHYLPAFSRVGQYDRAAARPPDERASRPHGRVLGARGRLHPARAVAALRVPPARVRAHGAATGAAGSPRTATLADWLRSELAANGPMRASEIEHDANVRQRAVVGLVRRQAHARVDVPHRRGRVRRATRFERVYALPEQGLPAELLGEPPAEADAVRELVALAASAHGIATEADLADYWRLKRPRVKQAIAELVDEGVLAARRGPGVDDRQAAHPAWLHRDARRPRRIEASAVLSPFDPVVWFRPRAERLFDFHYRIEIYTPEADRKFGYYSLPVLIDDRVVGRVDLKSDRKAGVLRVQSAWTEPDAPADTAARLAPVLRRAAAWQGLDDIAVAGRGDLSPALAAELAA